MKKKIFTACMAGLSIITLCGCGGTQNTGGTSGGSGDDYVYDPNSNNEKFPFRISIQSVDGIFNPFFSSTAPDSTVTSLTQLSMFTNDIQGNVAYGENQPTVVLDYEKNVSGSGDSKTTTYKMVLKNNIKFSNGDAMSIKDVLFNMYVYLDPAYTGSTTMYSTDIVGLNAYRTQSTSQAEQDAFKTQFTVDARQRIENLYDATQELKTGGKIFNSVEEFRTDLEAYALEAGEEVGENLVADFDKACELFEEEVDTDYSNSIDSYSTITFKNEAGVVHKNWFTTDTEAFLYNEGYITYNKKTDELSCSIDSLANVKTWDRQTAVNKVIEANLPNNIDEIITGWLTATNLETEIINQLMQSYFESHSTITNISGITFANQTGSVTVNNKTYAKPTYDTEDNLTSGNEVLQIVINGEDPKAIWNFSFPVAPMSYYSSQEQIDLFDFESHFGVVRGSTDFMNDYVKNSSRIGVPVGAGPYQAANYSGGTSNVQAGTFSYNGIIYYERNSNFVLGVPKIKSIRYVVVAESQIINSLQLNQIDYISPNASTENVNTLNSLESSGYKNQSVQTSGYGYIGINASKVPAMAVRQAIMHSIKTSETVSYYGTQAQGIYRPMSKSSWAYPDINYQYYPFVGDPIPSFTNVNPAYVEFCQSKGYKVGDTLTSSHQIEFIKTLVESAGYVLGGDGVYTKGSSKLKYTFTIAGDSKDHPAWNALFHAGDFLRDCGFDILVANDSQALKKLSSGSLTVWAAAWSTTIDPDMYQTYHKDSQASATKNWGYPTMLQNDTLYAEEVRIINDLSDIIEKARESSDQTVRKQYYARALDLVMQLCVELPTYQRDDLFAYNSNYVDDSSFNTDLSAFQGLIDKTWNLRLNETK